MRRDERDRVLRYCERMKRGFFVDEPNRWDDAAEALTELHAWVAKLKKEARDAD